MKEEQYLDWEEGEYTITKDDIDNNFSEQIRLQHIQYRKRNRLKKLKNIINDQRTNNKNA